MIDREADHPDEAPARPTGARWPARLGMAVVVVLSACVAVLLAWLAPAAAPVRAGSGRVFWRIVCGDIREPPGTLGGWHAYVSNSGAFLYEYNWMEGTDLYEAPAAEVKGQFEEAVSRIEQSPEKLRSYEREGFEAWHDGLPQSERTPESLLKSIDKALEARFEATRPGSSLYHRQERADVEKLLRHKQWYWATIVFEWTYLTGLTLWVLWPLIRGGRRLRWAVHLGLTPFLFFLPVYLGYATYTFTSAGPSGGVLYPWLIVWFRGQSAQPFAPLDDWILAHLPPLLGALSSPIGPAMGLTGTGLPGPTQTAAGGLALGLVIWSAPHLLKLYHNSARALGPIRR